MKPIFLLLLLAPAAATSAEPARFSSGAVHVPLIELFTSEGCSSCPPADLWLASQRQNPGLWHEFVPVEFHVNYWDSLGWKDRLSAPAFTARQRAYAADWGNDSVYTPCFVRDGVEWKPEWGRLSAQDNAPGELSVELPGDGTCRVSFTPRGGLRPAVGPLVGHVAILGGGLSSRVTAGENRGATLHHEFVVLGMAQARLEPDRTRSSLDAQVDLPRASVADARSTAVAAWVTSEDRLTPIQATGGWIP